MEMWTSGRITFHFLPQAVLMWHFRCVTGMLWLSIGGIALAPPELAASREQPTPGPQKQQRTGTASGIAVGRAAISGGNDSDDFEEPPSPPAQRTEPWAVLMPWAAVLRHSLRLGRPSRSGLSASSRPPNRKTVIAAVCLFSCMPVHCKFAWVR